jgi:hypothetical protein
VLLLLLPVLPKLGCCQLLGPVLLLLLLLLLAQHLN